MTSTTFKYEPQLLHSRTKTAGGVGVEFAAEGNHRNVSGLFRTHVKSHLCVLSVMLLCMRRSLEAAPRLLADQDDDGSVADQYARLVFQQRLFAGLPDVFGGRGACVGCRVPLHTFGQTRQLEPVAIPVHIHGDVDIVVLSLPAVGVLAAEHEGEDGPVPDQSAFQAWVPCQVMSA